MSVIDEITDSPTSVCTRLVASVCAVMDEKLSGQVDSRKLYEVVNFLLLSLTQTLTNNSSEATNFRLSFCAIFLRRTVVNIVKGMVPYINTKRKPNGREKYKWLDELDGLKE